MLRDTGFKTFKAPLNQLNFAFDKIGYVHWLQVVLKYLPVLTIIIRES